MSDEPLDPRVDAYINRAAPFAQPILAQLRKLMHQACPKVTESIKWGMSFFLQQGIVLCHMAAFKQHCALGFWGPEMKKVLAKDNRASSDAMGSLGRITSLKDLPADKTLLTYMVQAAEFVESGQRKKSIDRKPKPAKKRVDIPAELGTALKKNKLAAKAVEVSDYMKTLEHRQEHRPQQPVHHPELHPEASAESNRQSFYRMGV
jgi:uncharacterized protein YdhG (YjbR/CyaY superfamily)/uncharacterized short protein YbdD (DUF466 family)